MERKVEQAFVEEVRRLERAPKGWPAALLLFHMGMWRERMRNALTALSQGQAFEHPSENVDELNDAELPEGIGTPLADAAARVDHLLGEIIGLYAQLGERPFKWYAANDTTEAVLRNSFTHPRVHMAEYWKENGDLDRAVRLWQEAVTELDAASAPPRFPALARYNLACLKVAQGASDEAMRLLEAALPVSEVLRAAAPEDPDLAPLYAEPRFQELVKV